MYGPPGHAYVYLNYGIHALFNIVSEGEGSPAAILVRALDPIDGIPVMRRRRRTPAKGRRRQQRAGQAIARHDLCRGPGNLTMAMGITLTDNRADLLTGPLYVEDRSVAIGPVQDGPRIGIRVGTDRLWRFWIRNHPAVSG